MMRYRFMGLDKNGVIRCYAWSSSFIAPKSFEALNAFNLGEKRCWDAIKDFIKIEGSIYGQLTDWGTKWEIRKKGEKDNRTYLKKPSSPARKALQARRRNV